jgi:hypothetical protein
MNPRDARGAIVKPIDAYTCRLDQRVADASHNHDDRENESGEKCRRNGSVTVQAIRSNDQAGSIERDHHAMSKVRATYNCTGKKESE